MDSDEDFGSDIDDSEFIAAATQAEQEFSSNANRTISNGGDLLPPDDFIDDADIEMNDFMSFSQAPIPPRGNLRQTTLFGASVVEASSPQQQKQKQKQQQQQQRPRANWPLSNQEEKPTHHKIDREAAKTWIYPINVSYRDYQYNIVRRALLSNVLCALPTGLGKTFIAATVMLNWFRWAPEGQIAFLAPTKPLVHQQIEACFTIAGIPRSQTATMTGGVPKALRQEYWEERRVFFTTPQTMQNDIKNGLCDPKRIICLVVDEAHRTTGAYAYGEVVKLVRRENTSFRLLALTATPGSTVEAVQGVIDGLGISRVEIRTDESLDIRQYIQRRNLEVQTFSMPPEMVELRDLYCKCLEPQLKKLNAGKAFYQTRAENLTPFGVISAMGEWRNSAQARNMNKGYFFGLMKLFKNLASLAHPLGLLETHGVRLFYDKLINAREDETDEEVTKSAVNSIRKEKPFTQVLERAAQIVADPNFSGHPKVDFMVNAILKHFSEAEDEDTKRETRIMVFTSFRDSAEEVTRMLRRHEPLIRPHVFVGQANSGKNSAGMSQKQQLDIISKFSDGTYNTLVSTSIGEEGLDIGEVDLIVCYDTSASPIRLLQRMGRTGRKRVGSVLVLLSEGREHDKYKRALDNYAVMQKKIASGADFSFPHELSPRIIPKDIDPQPDKKHIEIPVENTQPEPDKRKPRTKKKAPIKKFFMPEGVQTGFTKASRIGKEHVLSTDSSGGESENAARASGAPGGTNEEPLAPLLDDYAALLTEAEQLELHRHYIQDFSGQDTVIVEHPRLDKFPETQRNLGPIKHVPHSVVTKRFVNMIGCMRAIDDARLERFQSTLDRDLLKSPKKTLAFKPVRPAAKPPAKPLLAQRKLPVKLKEKRGARNDTDDGDDDDVEIISPPPPPPKARTRGKLVKLAAPPLVSSGDDEDVVVTSKRKRQKVSTAGSDSDSSLPDAADLLNSFRWAGSGQKTM